MKSILHARVWVHVVLFIQMALCDVSLQAGDWPMWRYDASRSNASPDALPKDLQLQWVRTLPAPRPAWPASQTKLQFDEVCQPIVIGKLMIVGSTTNDSITAFDTETGTEVWRFYTDGPVRFAPAAYRDKIYAASDDGNLYCLKTATGQLIRKIAGGPYERRIIGNGRVISTWPIRGGPVIVDNTVYFTASIWPYMGIFVHAVDANTGESVWVNSETGSRWVTHPHGAPSFGSIVPQGYLAATGDRLIVPGGRSLPGIFDRHTGEMQRFEFGGKGDGGWRVIANADMYVVQDKLFTMSKGEPVSSVPTSVLTADLLLGGTKAHRIRNAIKLVETVDRKGKKIEELQYKPKESFSVCSPDLSVFILAGNQVFSGRDGLVASFDLETAANNKKVALPSWSTEIDGTPVAMLAGDDKLFVVTKEAKIFCFGAKKVLAKQHDLRPMKPLARHRSDFAETILADDRSAPGYAVALGIGSGDLIDEVLASSQLDIIVIDPDPSKVERLRRAMNDRGVYGTRIVAHVGDPASFDLPPYLANVIFGDTLQDVPPVGIVQLGRKIFESLRPYGGTLCLRLSDTQHKALQDAIGENKFANSELSRDGKFSSLRRVGSLPGAGTWTHQYADAANSVVSQDTLVKAPLGLLWFGGPPNDKVLPRHGHGPSPQVAGGRLVIEGADMLRSVDVYTGRVFWERELPGLGEYYDTTRHFPGAGEIGSNYVTLPDSIYTVYRKELLQLDAGTGKTLRRFTFKQDSDSPPASWGFLAAEGDFLIATSSPVEIRGEDATAKTPPEPANKKSKIPDDMTPVIASGDEWIYLAGQDPAKNWTAVDFNPGDDWTSGATGFGYGDDDDRTKLKGMKGKYSRVYARRKFLSSDLKEARKVVLSVNYDDAFIAYLNGREIVRKGIKVGNGSDASGITGHEATGFESFEVKDFAKLLKSGKNVLAIEGHNAKPTSSDFTLDPQLLVDKIAKKQSQPTQNSGKSTAQQAAPQPKGGRLVDVLTATDYASSSRQLVVMNRHDGRVLWRREAAYSFRHNAIVVADDRIYCIDSMSEQQRQTLSRRGIKSDEKPRLLALDASTGKELWFKDEDVFGTFLNYSHDHDVLLQAGSSYRDRAKDEAGKGMVAYRASDGKVLWKDLSKEYDGPCLLLRDKIITNGGGGYELDLLTGVKTGWNYKRMYGCNTAVGSQNLLTFRSGAAGFCDLANDSGTGNIGGFRSSCTANLIVADGVLNAPDYTRTCSCAYQNQSSLALIHMPHAEQWMFSNLTSPPNEFAVNLGAPGDRRGPNGMMWFDQPSVGGNSPKLPVKIEGKSLRSVRHHMSRIENGDEAIPWVTSSVVVGIKNLRQETPDGKQFTVRLHFAELEGLEPGERVFDVSIQGKRVLKSFDIAGETGGAMRGTVKEFGGITTDGTLDLSFSNEIGEACLSGVQVIIE